MSWASYEASDTKRLKLKKGGDWDSYRDANAPTGYADYHAAHNERFTATLNGR